MNTKLYQFSNMVHLRQFCTKVLRSPQSRDVNVKYAYGQPTFETHPHLLKEGELTPLLTKFEYQNRRHSLVESILKNSKRANNLIVVPAASKQYMSDKIPYVFRQNTEFLYLTGCQEPDCCVVISSSESNDSPVTTLFTRDIDDHAEQWDGPRTHPEAATGLFGVDQSLPTCEFEKFLESHKRNKNTMLWYDFSTTVQQSVHQLMYDFVKDSNMRNCENPKHYIQKLRLYKSPSEITLLQRACDITAEAFTDTIACSKPGIGENQLFAKIDFECRMRGAEILAYPPVVAGGNRATTIHYINNNQTVNDKELILMDAGCEYHGYSSDVTRTWPVNGRFSPEQRKIYEVVHDVQVELINMCGSFPTLDALFESMCYLLGKKLQEIGLIGIQPSDNYLMKAAHQLCPHHVSHYLGMDVHDTPSISRNIRLAPGMVITIEPGIYITAKHKSIPKEFHGIGMRIEDDVLITENGPVVLSRNCPKHINEIEKIASQNQD